MHILKISTSQQRDLWSHLLPSNSMQEQAAFLFCKTSGDAKRVTFETIDQTLLGKEDFLVQHGDYLELTDKARIDVIKHAHMLNTSLVEFHSHPKSWLAAFSPVDRAGLRETVPHMRWRLKKRPYAAVVVTPSSFDALVWCRDSLVPEALSIINASGRLISPTNASLEGWNNG